MVRCYDDVTSWLSPDIIGASVDADGEHNAVLPLLIQRVYLTAMSSRGCQTSGRRCTYLNTLPLQLISRPMPPLPNLLPLQLILSWLNLPYNLAGLREESLLLPGSSNSQMSPLQTRRLYSQSDLWYSVSLWIRSSGGLYGTKMALMQFPRTCLSSSPAAPSWIICLTSLLLALERHRLI